MVKTMKLKLYVRFRYLYHLSTLSSNLNRFTILGRPSGKLECLCDGLYGTISGNFNNTVSHLQIHH